MSLISLIAAIDEAGGLGINNQLLCYLPADLQHFKFITMGKPVIMGRKTYESIGKPLPGRLNIVISQMIQSIPGVIVVNSLGQAIEETADAREVMIIGGARIYSQAISMANRLYITRIHHRFMADVFFPKINELEWDCRSKEFQQHDEKNQYDMTFCLYERTSA
ncbi:dihydrofolate reductase [Legionella pneumophila]|uniref:Dihydrofolate reductase n=1 Tax=Legionella pneumophila subsp. pascullei TaxID=91890 RepID=A0AAX2IS54_LEGPN|nr:dihydrofolate reductase [Legionella pneumophila]AMP88471.1 dihydrofolate reductase [Legionella pneumophila subsp. pascullei]AMP91380.1 dihydrofolate reductase [Legionella pneumophila subsp. pascullei]AMP94368.1 dihydrofolate reductase [Legionella pneumophila subsp. pascullei]SQG89162.1 dihydrofolate reductase [Legionella pneumophila subsp. pascullei]VEH04212.1 dihydrofolate reductase [Legionella pneumophila subsp. pascullei]